MKDIKTVQDWEEADEEQICTWTGKPGDFVAKYHYEKAVAKEERHSKRWMVAFFAVFVAFCLSNIAWIYYESQFEDVVVTQDNGDAPNNYIGNDGSIYNGSDTFSQKEVAEDGEADH